MEGLLGLFIGIGFVVGFVLVMRLIGAWMLRIDECFLKRTFRPYGLTSSIGFV